MQIPRFRCKMTLHLIPEPEEKASELLRDLTANDMYYYSCICIYIHFVSMLFVICMLVSLFSSYS